MVWILLFIAFTLVVIAGLIDWQLTAIRNQLLGLRHGISTADAERQTTNDLLRAIERQTRPEAEDRADWTDDDWIARYPTEGR